MWKLWKSDSLPAQSLLFIFLVTFLNNSLLCGHCSLCSLRLNDRIEIKFLDPMNIHLLQGSSVYMLGLTFNALPGK